MSGDNHVKRQERARVNKKSTEERANWQPSKKSRVVQAHNSIPSNQGMDQSPGHGQGSLSMSDYVHLRQQSSASATSADSLLNNVHTRQHTISSPTGSPIATAGGSGSTLPEFPSDFNRRSNQSPQMNMQMNSSRGPGTGAAGASAGAGSSAELDESGYFSGAPDLQNMEEFTLVRLLEQERKVRSGVGGGMEMK